MNASSLDEVYLRNFVSKPVKFPSNCLLQSLNKKNKDEKNIFPKTQKKIQLENANEGIINNLNDFEKIYSARDKIKF